jgi:hypothetical protein
MEDNRLGEYLHLKLRYFLPKDSLKLLIHPL